MDRQGEEVHVTTEEARGGQTGLGMRYVLVISLVLVVVVLAALWLLGVSGPAQSGQAAASTEVPAAAAS